MSIEGLFINDDVAYLEGWVKRNGLANYLQRLKDQSYKQILLKYKSSEVEKVKKEYNAKRIEANKMILNDFNKNKNSALLTQGLNSYIGLLEAQVLNNLESSEGLSYDVVNLNIDKEYAKIKDALARDKEIYKTIHSTSYNKKVEDLHKVTAQIDAKKKEDSFEKKLKDLPKNIFQDNLGKAVGGALKNKIDKMADAAMRESGVNYVSNTNQNTASSIQGINRSGVRVTASETADSLNITTAIDINEDGDLFKDVKKEKIKLFSEKKEELGIVSDLIESSTFDTKMSNYKRAYIYNTLKWGGSNGFFQSKLYDLEGAIVNSYLDIAIQKSSIAPLNLLDATNILLDGGVAINIYDILLKAGNKVIPYLDFNSSASDEIESYRNGRMSLSIPNII